MEDNLTDALKMAFAVLTFVMALSLCIVTFTQARITSEAVLYMRDDTNYYEYIEAGTERREVGMETIIPTLYRYYKENYIVNFKNRDGSPMVVYRSQKTGGNISSFDVNAEVMRREPWTGNVEKDYKLNLDAILSGGYFFYPDGSASKYNYTINNPLYNAKQNNLTFYETAGEYQYKKSDDGSINIVRNTTIDDGSETIELVKQEVKRVITYTLK